MMGTKIVDDSLVSVVKKSFLEVMKLLAAEDAVEVMVVVFLGFLRLTSCLRVGGGGPFLATGLDFVSCLGYVIPLSFKLRL